MRLPSERVAHLFSDRDARKISIAALPLPNYNAKPAAGFIAL